MEQKDEKASKRFNITPGQQAELDNIFSYHPPFGDQPQRYEALRQAAKYFALVILENTPKSADQSAAIRKVREAVMTANAAIAIGEAPQTAGAGAKSN